MKTNILMRFVNKGVHYWPGVEQKYPELARLHPHTFVIVAQFEETKSREIEFVRFRRLVWESLAAEFGERLWNFGPLSCEDIAKFVAYKIRQLLREDRRVIVTVWEDDEGCAGSVTYEEGEKIEGVPRPKRDKRPTNTLVA